MGLRWWSRQQPTARQHDECPHIRRSRLAAAAEALDGGSSGPAERLVAAHPGHEQCVAMAVMRHCSVD